MKAFYYEDYYYLIPEPFADLEDFRAQVDPEQPVSLIWLQEEHCMAPYFVSEQTCRAERRIQRPENMFPAEVWILTQKEYDKRLRAVVEKNCPGCLRFGGNASDLTGHHAEISLDGICCEREWDVDADEKIALEKEPFEFRYAVDFFWGNFRDAQQMLIALIEQGCIRDAIEEIRRLLDFLPISVVALSKYAFWDGNRTTKKYVLMVSACGISHVSLFIDYLITGIPEDIAQTWDAFSYFLKPFYRYTPTFGVPDVSKAPPELRLCSLPDGSLTRILRVSVHMEEVKKQRPDIIQGDEIPSAVELENYLYLCQEIGEDKLLGSTDFIEYTDIAWADPAEERMTSAEYYAQVMELLQEPEYEIIYPNFFVKGFIASEPSTVREGLSVAHSRCIALTNDLVFGTCELLPFVWDQGVLLGTLALQMDAEDLGYIMEPMREEEHDDPRKNVLDYVISCILEKLSDQRNIKMLGMSCGEHTLYYDFVIMEKCLTRKTIRALTPVLKPYGTIYTEHCPDGAKVYEVDYIMREITEK